MPQELISFKNAEEFFTHQQERVNTCLDMVQKFGGVRECFDWTKIEPIKHLAETIFSSSTNGVKTFLSTSYDPTHDAATDAIADNINLLRTPIQDLSNGNNYDMDLIISDLRIHSVDYNTGLTAITNCYGLNSKPTCSTLIKETPKAAKTIYDYAKGLFFDKESTLWTYTLEQESSDLWRETLSRPQLSSTTLVTGKNPKLFQNYFATFASGEDSTLSPSPLLGNLVGTVVGVVAALGLLYIQHKYVRPVPFLFGRPEVQEQEPTQLTVSSNQLTDPSTNQLTDPSTEERV
jgi:hypothetical protein